MITVSAYTWVPPFARGLVRDMRVRWALEEAGVPYRTRLMDPRQPRPAEHRAIQPFGQVPTYEEDGLALFESGAIVLHIAAQSPVLFPADAAGRARATTWVLAALNSMEPPIQALAGIDLFYANEEWAKLRRPGAETAAKQRLSELAARLAGRDWLEDRFTVGDLMMTTVLRILRHTDLVAAEPALKAYVARNEARPAFQRAVSAQMADFTAA
jgi:glutathione S-transferase